VNLFEIEQQLVALKSLSIAEIEAQLAPLQIQLDRLKPQIEEVMGLERKKGYFLGLRDTELHIQKRKELLDMKTTLLANEPKQKCGKEVSEMEV